MRAVLTLGTALVAAGALAQPIYRAVPDWMSSDTQVSTGAALVDLDRDGWLDLVVANGNDMAEQHVAVYYNGADGTLPPRPDWESDDFVYNGQLDVADVNGDGWLDVAVATLGEFDTTGPIARLYLNNLGTLSSMPDWSANIIGNAFGVAFGDMNNDGRPDLAVGTGWAYDPQHHYRNYVYLNVEGGLSATPAWSSSDTVHSQGMLWVDIDGDGWLDLVSAASRAASLAYRNLGNMLKTSPSWVLTDLPHQDVIMVTAGDVTGDGNPDLFMADNNQLNGSGRFRQYRGRAGALFETVASWTYFDGYCSAVALADLNADGKLDLVTGGWWRPARVFLNTGNGISSTPIWSSGRTSAIEKIAFGDIDKLGLRSLERAFTPVPTGRRLFYLPHQPVQEVNSVYVDGEPLTFAQYTFSREHGWITIGVDAFTKVRVEYTYSTRLDMAVTNWDDTIGNFVYHHQRFVMGDANCDGQVTYADINPFVMLLSGTYDEQYPDCDGLHACDFDGDGAVTTADIQPFVAALSR